MTPEQQAWREGYNANDRGQWHTACPYLNSDPRSDSWHEGWKAAERDRYPTTD